MLVYILFQLVILQAVPGFGSIEGRVEFVDDSVSRQGVLAQLRLGDSLIRETYVNEQGLFEFKTVETGIYTLSIKQIGYRLVSVNDLVVGEDALVKVNVQFPHPIPCPYDYQVTYRPVCIGGHTDKIIPIIYGLPDKKRLKKARKGKIHLAGCNVTNCDPRYYCVVHNREF